MNETEGDATGRDAATLCRVWWGEKSERLVAFGRGKRKGGRGRGGGGTKAETTRQF